MRLDGHLDLLPPPQSNPPRRKVLALCNAAADLSATSRQTINGSSRGSETLLSVFKRLQMQPSGGSGTGVSVARPRDLFRVWPVRATEVGGESGRQPNVLKIVATEIADVSNDSK